MGDVKNQMQPTSEKGKKLFGLIQSKKKTPEKKEEQAETFCDQLVSLEESLSKLVTIKQAEFKSESGREQYNMRGLLRLETMQFHLDQIIEHAAEYSKG